MKLIDKNRRTVIKGIAAGALLSPLLMLQSCDSDSSADTEEENSGETPERAVQARPGPAAIQA